MTQFLVGEFLLLWNLIPPAIAASLTSVRNIPIEFICTGFFFADGTVSGYMIFTTTIEGQALFAIPCNLLRIPSVFVLASGLRFGSEIIMTMVLLLISTSVTFWMVPDELFHVYAFLSSPSLC